MSNMNMKHGNVITECILDMWSGWFTAPDLKSISVRVSPCIRLPTTKETKTVIHWVLELSSGQQGCGHRGRANTFLLLVLVTAGDWSRQTSVISSTTSSLPPHTRRGNLGRLTHYHYSLRGGSTSKIIC